MNKDGMKFESLENGETANYLYIYHREVWRYITNFGEHHSQQRILEIFSALIKMRLL